ncbi:MAG TPA: hypothetical protein VGR43_08575, partial [Dehalococcoidia bacterium]|nr:hypothetical protein [Dehalococcoidia bacterium]
SIAAQTFLRSTHPGHGGVRRFPFLPRRQTHAAQAARDSSYVITVHTHAFHRRCIIRAWSHTTAGMSSSGVAQ